MSVAHTFLFAVGNSMTTWGKLPPLPGVARDVGKIFEAIVEGERGRGLADRSRSVKLLDEGASKVKDRWEQFIGAIERDALVVFYFAGHGALVGETDLRLLLANSEPSRPGESTLQVLQVIQALENKSVAEWAVILDCCESGEATRDRAIQGALSKKNLGSLIVCATSSGNVWETEHGAPFTSLLTKAIISGSCMPPGAEFVNILHAATWATERLRGPCPVFYSWAAGANWRVARTPGHEPATLSERLDAFVPATASEPNWTTSRPGPVALPAVAVDASAYREIEFDIGSLWGLDRGPWIGVWHGPVDAAARTMHECERLIRRVFVDDPEPLPLATRRWHRARVTRGGDIPRDLNDLAALSAPERFGDPGADELGVLLEMDRESFEREAQAWISALARLSSWPAIVLVAPLSARVYALSARKQLAAALPGAWVDVQIAVDTTAGRWSEDRHAWPRRDGASASAHNAAVDGWTEAILGGTSERPAALPADWGERLQAARSSADSMHPLDRYDSIVLGLLRWANRGVPERLPVLAAALKALPGRSHPRLAELVRRTLMQADPGLSEWQPDRDVALVALRAGLSPPPPREEDPRTWWPITAQPPSQRLLEVLKRLPAAQRGMFGLFRPEERRTLEADESWQELATECRRGISRRAP